MYSRCVSVLAFNDTIRLLPARSGSQPLTHSITSFKNVRIAPDALLGEVKAIPPGREAYRLNLLNVIFRAAIGAAALPCLALAIMERCVYIVARYSQHRTIGAPGEEKAIISFRTQHQPILVGLAQAAVYSELQKVVIKSFQDSDRDPRFCHAYATMFKAMVLHAALSSTFELSERCGARGLFEANVIARSHVSLRHTSFYHPLTLLKADMRGITIAEGDILVLCISKSRLFYSILHVHSMNQDLPLSF